MTLGAGDDALFGQDGTGADPTVARLPDGIGPLPGFELPVVRLPLIGSDGEIIGLDDDPSASLPWTSGGAPPEPGTAVPHPPGIGPGAAGSTPEAPASPDPPSGQPFAGPGGARPGGAGPGSADPGGADPGSAGPGSAGPGSADPGSAGPGSAGPGGAGPGGADPGSTAPDGAGSGSAAPGSTASPQRAEPLHRVPEVRARVPGTTPVERHSVSPPAWGRTVRPTVVDEPGILGLSRRSRSRLGSRLFTLFFVAVFGVILVQLVLELLYP